MSRFGRPGFWRGLCVLWLGGLLAACAGTHPDAPNEVEERHLDQYIIGPGDTLNVSVWRNPDLSTSVPVRPDGQITTPLVEDVQASGVTPTELARTMEEELSRYIRDPVVTVVVTGFAGPYDRQVRVIGQAAQPQALQYREHMTVLDVMIAVGGITDFAAGNRAVIIRHENGERKQYRVRLDDLVNGGDITANVDVLPGDTLIIPERFF
ncbi:XrtA/PEP-CTERM system exopolysaccharide export protein [Alkalilimnicola ehrlichii MLHE-1]|uniref:Polysaccharide export protein n=1 Tax=Alkalilimnicola ehrlichii (strain ATCC BAA-1101 / DSM 17681 / MLHE-1) TaxID=187272 RepID=Q0ACC2_ALKEH|nr:XrtA/PEP-CTERM system exopolysaccharide export protein [Alkalilimnicola ehrlichii]ABI55515.1 polysaccharide export protein [Alkalilimnicola ehrlichii MLHE-1]